MDFQKSIEKSLEKIDATICVHGEIKNRRTYRQVKNLLFAIEDYHSIVEKG